MVISNLYGKNEYALLYTKTKVLILKLFWKKDSRFLAIGEMLSRAKE